MRDDPVDRGPLSRLHLIPLIPRIIKTNTGCKYKITGNQRWLGNANEARIVFEIPSRFGDINNHIPTGSIIPYGSLNPTEAGMCVF
jgi:hypothetical protein